MTAQFADPEVAHLHSSSPRFIPNQETLVSHPLTPKRPKGTGWEKLGGDTHVTQVEPGYWFESWLHPNLVFAISAVEVAWSRT
jgi:hypothetical protein